MQCSHHAQNFGSPVRMARSPVRMVYRSPVRMVRSPVRMVYRSPVRMVRSPVRMVNSPVRMCHAPSRAVRMAGAKSSNPIVQKLLDAGAKFYGAEWCGYCKKQLAEHPDLKMLYVECKDGGCKTSDGKEVTGFPTWDVKGKVSGGYRKLEALTELC